MSSVMPSRKYSSSLTPLRFSKYSTATDFSAGLAPRRRAGRDASACRRRARIEIAPKPHQIGLEVRGRLVAEVAVLLERLVEHAAELRRQRRIELGGRRADRDSGWRRRRLPTCRPGRAGRPWPSDRAPRRARRGRCGRRSAARAPAPATCSVTVPIARARARQIVARAPSSRPRARRRAARRRAVELGEAEVEDLHLAARVDEDVGRLDVAMNDALGVRRFERVGDLDRRRPAADRSRTARAPISSRQWAAPPAAP